MRIAVAGAGIAGLTAAIALAGRGFAVELFERAAELGEIGAGIQLSPNAMAVLMRLGVADELRDAIAEPLALVIRSASSAALLATLPLGSEARTRYGQPYATLLRSDLQAALLAIVRRDPMIRLTLGASVGDVRTANEGVTFTAGGGEHRADVLVGADGIHSVVRAKFFRHAGARSLGRTAWRAMLPSADAEGLAPLDSIGLWMGAGAHLVHYPAGAFLNLVAIAAEDGPAPPPTPFGRKARALLESVGVWKATPLAQHRLSDAWTRGNVVLVGDAAHAMAPSAAQGGAQAIEDGWVLARTLAAANDAPAATLARFERIRRPRVERVVSLSQSNLSTYELRGALALARDAALRILPARLFSRRQDWLFGWQPP